VEISWNSSVNQSDPGRGRREGPFAPWEALAEPTSVFAHPRDVLEAAHLGREEKRAILASWASDAFAVESAPALRHCPGLPGCLVGLDEVLDALRSLDPEPQREGPSESVRGARIRWLRPRWPNRF
jgi:hypothetical protein